MDCQPRVLAAALGHRPRCQPSDPSLFSRVLTILCICRLALSSLLSRTDASDFGEPPPAVASRFAGRGRYYFPKLKQLYEQYQDQVPEPTPVPRPATHRKRSWLKVIGRRGCKALFAPTFRLYFILYFRECTSDGLFVPCASAFNYLWRVLGPKGRLQFRGRRHQQLLPEEEEPVKREESSVY